WTGGSEVNIYLRFLSSLPFSILLHLKISVSHFFSRSLSPASCHVLYGERIGLFSTSPSQESQKFIFAVERMLATTPPLLYLPPRLLWRLGSPLWTQHATAWDHIFSHAEKRIQRGVQRLRSTQAAGGGSGGTEGEFTGILGQLMDKGQLSLELIRANITELMAGGVDTVVAANENVFSVNLPGKITVK
ncbi:cholesterol side-chain cleavage enzyme, mitochondrial-like, partial [Salvelinus fontinalis]|uniref:cholesterol side-chain cleavage enzyme, mitochondrial-like n=1 Tax=Salvelinus fontinalis TaxID=8038 RepID=UPI0024869D04